VNSRLWKSLPARYPAMPVGSPMILFGLLATSVLPAATKLAHISLVQINAQALNSTKQDDFTLPLPQIETVLANSTKTFDDILKQTSLLEAALMQKQGEFREQLSKLKQQYEAKLDLQSQENNEIKASIGQVTDSLKKTRASNRALRTSSLEIQQNNSRLRTQLKKLESKLQTAEAFASLTLNVTADMYSSELEVLNTPKPIQRKEPHPSALAALESSETVEQAMDYMVYGRHGADGVDEDADDAAEVSALLQLGSALGEKVVLSYPQSWRSYFDSRQSQANKMDTNAKHVAQTQTSAVSVVSVLSSGLAEVETQYRKGVESLRTTFQQHFDAGSQRRSALLAHKERATHKLESVLAVNSKLQLANAALQKTQKELGQRIKGIKTFLLQVSGNEE